MWRAAVGRCHFRGLPFTVVILLDDICEDETISVAGDGANETRRARVVAEHPADRANGLAQRAIGDDDVAPDTIEDVAAVHGLAAMLDEKHEQIEVPGYERLLAPVADEHAAARRQDEFAEAIAEHSLTSPRLRHRWAARRPLWSCGPCVCDQITPDQSTRAAWRTERRGRMRTHARRSRCPRYTPASTSPPPSAMNGPNGSPRSGTASARVASGSR